MKNLIDILDLNNQPNLIEEIKALSQLEESEIVEIKFIYDKLLLVLVQKLMASCVKTILTSLLHQK